MGQVDPSRTSEGQRRTERVLLRIPIEVKGSSPDGKPFTATGHTLVINHHGARISLQVPLRAGDSVSITNLQNRTCCSFRVVGRLEKTLGLGLEWGVECLDPDINFWGIAFPKKLQAPIAEPTEERIDALVECTACHFRELAHLSFEEYRTLSTQRRLSRQCPRCAGSTNWYFSFAGEDVVEMAEDEKVGQAARLPVSSQPAERRKAKRLTAKLPLRVRLADGQMQVARTENLSKMGICFRSILAIKEGEVIRIAVGAAPGGAEPEISARVVWKKEFGEGMRLYGVRVEG